MPASPITEMREAIIAALNDEFEPDGIEFISDKMHPANGLDGPRGAVYPGNESNNTARRIENVNVAFVQVFAQWHKDVDPLQVFDPTPVEAWAERLREALKEVQDVHSSTTWFFFVTDVDYMDDPTGNRSRFLARVQGVGPNTNLVETGP